MKYQVLFLLFFCLPGLAVQAQSKKELAAGLMHDLETYRRVSTEKKLDSMLLFMPPAIFEIVPLDSLVALTAKSMDNDNFSIAMSALEYIAKPKIKKAGTYYWAFVPYTGQMKMSFKKQDSINKLMLTLMRSKFGKENVREEADGMAMLITLKNKNLIAVKDPELPHWSLLEDKREEAKNTGMQKVMFEAAIPEEVRKAFGKK